MPGRNDIDVRPNHDLIADLDTAHVVNRTALINKDLATHTDLLTVGGIERRNEPEALIERLPGQPTE